MTLARLDMCAARINKRYSDYSLLDVGCRTMDLKPKLTAVREYFGADIVPGKDILECNLEKKLPFADGSFDIVTALDVLEHLNDPHGAFGELLRISRKAVFVSLPNMYYVEFRLRFLRGKGISGKYRFPPNSIIDRHRWVLSYDEAVAFISQNAQDREVESEMIMPVRGRTKAIAGPIERQMAKTWPNAFAYGALFEIRQRPNQ